MIGFSRSIRVFAYAAPADLRRSFEGLSAIVRQELGRDPLSGELFAFINRRCNRAKLLHFDGSGLWVHAKRLDQGQFACLWRDRTCRELELTLTELQLLMEGSKLVGRVMLSPPPITQEELAIAIS